MKEIVLGVKELQAHLGTALRAVREGKRVVISDRHEPFAEIVTLRKPVKRLSALERRLERLAQAGRLTLGRPGAIPAFAPLRIGGLVEQVLADRR